MGVSYVSEEVQSTLLSELAVIVCVERVAGNCLI